MLRFLSILLLTLLILGLKSEEAPPENGGVSSHDFHISYGMMVIEDNQAMLRIRLFTDDLEKGLKQYHKDASIKLSVNPRTDSLVMAYLNNTLVLQQNEKVVPGVLANSGEDDLYGFPVWWYTLSYEAPAKLEQVHIKHTTLMDMFDDQQNIIKITQYPSEEEKTYYFVKDASDITLRFEAG